MNTNKAFCWSIILCVFFFCGCNPIDHDSDDDNDNGVNLTIEQNSDTILFKIECSNKIYIPHASLSSPPYLSGPWAIYHLTEGTDSWSALEISNMCASPWCSDDSCDGYAVCSAFSTPPQCEIISDEYELAWNKMHVVSGKQFCNGEERSCFEFSVAEPGDYKVVFSFKTEPCLTYHENSPLGEEKGFFYEDIKTIEKEFSIK